MATTRSAGDNGQMSTTTLSNIFKDICTRAGFAGDSRVHLHAMRHTCAHLLDDCGNTTKQIALILGHKSTKITETVYLRDSFDRQQANVIIPQDWQDREAKKAAMPVVVDATQSGSRPGEGHRADAAAPGSSRREAKQAERETQRELARRMVEVLSKLEENDP